MTLKFDHAVIAVNNLDEAVADYQRAGFNMIYGGEHASGTTRNALICFQDGSYLELLAPTGKPPRPGIEAVDFRRVLEKGEGLIGYALASDNLQAEVAAMRSRAIPVGDVQAGGRKRQDGVELRWQTAMVDGRMSPFFIQDVTPRRLRVHHDDPTSTLHTNGVVGVTKLHFIAEDLDITAQRYQNVLGLQPKRDSTNNILFVLDQTALIFSKPSDEEMRRHAAERGDALYSLFLATGGQAAEFDIRLTHGARLISEK